MMGLVTANLRALNITMNHLIEYIPIATTLFALYFSLEIYRHYKERKKSYLLWWTIGVITFGLGTPFPSNVS